MLGLTLVGRDERLQVPIRKQLASNGRPATMTTPRRREVSPAVMLTELADDRRKLLELYYGDRISADGFQEEERRLCGAIERARARATDEQHDERAKSDLELRFEQVAAILMSLDIEDVWKTADDSEKRVSSKNWLSESRSSPITWKSKSWVAHRSTSCSPRLD